MTASSRSWIWRVVFEVLKIKNKLTNKKRDENLNNLHQKIIIYCNCALGACVYNYCNSQRML